MRKKEKIMEESRIMRTERNKKPLEVIAELETRNVEADITIKQLLADNEQLSAALCRLQEALTPSIDTKSAYVGTFVYSVDGFDDDGNACSDEVCVPWHAIKDIMKVIRERAAVEPCKNE
jgi:hypothetical protein